MDWSKLNWNNGEWWWAVLATVALLAIGQVLLFAWRRRVRTSIGDPRLVERLVATTSRPLQVLKAILAVAAFALVLVTALRPQYGLRENEIVHRGVDVAVLLDVSQSMLVRDIAPDRFTASKREIVKTLKGLRGGRVSLLPFYFFPYVQSPLTSDFGAIEKYLDELRLQDIAPPEMRGTSLGRALNMAVGVLNRDEARIAQAMATDNAAGPVEEDDDVPPDVKRYRGSRYKAIVLFTDGEENEAVPEDILQSARDAGIRIYAVGVGTRAGHAVPAVTEDGQITGVLKKAGDEPVFSSLNEELLRGLADATSGGYFHFANRSVSDDLVAALDGLEKQQYEAEIEELGEDRFQFVLLPALLLLLLEALLSDRRRRPLIDEEVTA